MFKLLLLLFVGFIAYRLFRGYISQLSKEEGAAQVSKAENMVRCTYCGVHLPRSESILSDGKSYCSEEHQRLS